MANFTWTAADVLPGSGGAKTVKTAGEAITRGMPVVESSSKVYKADANHATAALKGKVDGIALSDAVGDGAPIIIGSSDITVTFGAGVFDSAGQAVYLSATAGALAPEADLVAGDRVTLVGVSTSETALKLFVTQTSIDKT